MYLTRQILFFGIRIHTADKKKIVKSFLDLEERPIKVENTYQWGFLENYYSIKFDRTKKKNKKWKPKNLKILRKSH